MAENQEVLKSLLMKVKEESEKAGSKCNILKTKIVASGPSLHGKQVGKQWKQWQTLFSWAAKSLQMVTAAMKLKTLAPWKKSFDQPRQHIRKQRLTWLTKVHLVKAVVFPVSMYICESWTINKAEHQRTDVFELWCWRRLLRVPWTAKRSKQSIVKGINTKYSLEGLMLKLKLKYFGHLMRRAN